MITNFKFNLIGNNKELTNFSQIAITLQPTKILSK